MQSELLIGGLFWTAVCGLLSPRIGFVILAIVALSLKGGQ